MRWRDTHAAQSALDAGRSLVDTPLERAGEIEQVGARFALDAQRALEHARFGSADASADRTARALWHVAQVYADVSRGNYQLARNEAETAASLAPHDPHVSFARALVAVRRNEAALALRYLGQLETENAPAALHDRAEMLHADLELDAGNGHPALARLEALDRAHPAVTAVANRLGLARAAVGDRDGARDAYARAASLDSHDEQPLVNLGRLERASGETAAARATLEHAVALVPSSATAHLALGIVLADLHDDGARSHLVRASELAPTDAAPLVALGDLDLAAGDSSAAAARFREALECSPDDATAETNLAIALARQGDRAGAATAFEHATRHAPGQGEAWNGLGAMKLALGDAAGAIGPLEHAVRLLADDPNPSLNLGLALERLERWDEAARAFREALRRSPGHEVALRHLLAITPANDRPRELRRIGRLAVR